MSPEIERLRELGSLMRAAHADLGALQIQLPEAHERKLNPAQLGIHIADLGRQISGWRREQKSLSRRISLDGAFEPESSPCCSFILNRLKAEHRRPAGIKQSEEPAAASVSFTRNNSVVAYPNHGTTHSANSRSRPRRISTRK